MTQKTLERLRAKIHIAEPSGMRYDDDDFLYIVFHERKIYFMCITTRQVKAKTFLDRQIENI